MIISKPSVEDVLELGLVDPVYFLRFHLEHWFPDRVPWFHRGLAAIITRTPDFLLKYGELDKIQCHFRWIGPDGKLNPIFDFGDGDRVRMIISPNSNNIIPRGFGKTTLINGLSIRDCSYRLLRYLLYVSESATHAEDQVIAQRREWEQNESLILHFGEQASDRQDSRRWTNDVLEFRNGCFIRGVGRGGQIRGKNFRAMRPNKIIVDDVEDEESVLSPTQRDKTKKWYYGSLVPALPAPGRRQPTDGIINIGTLLSSECLLRTVADDPRFNTVVLGAIDLDGEPLWPEQQSLAQIEEEREASRKTGTLSIFYREKLSQIRNDEDADFHEEALIVEALDPGRLVAVAIACDPAISEKAGASRAAIYIVGKYDTGFTWVLDGMSGTGWTPRQLIDNFFDLRNRWRNVSCGVRFAGIESIGYQRALIFLMREEMAKRNDYFEITPITHGHTSKITRIKGVLQPRYAARMMRHARPFERLFADLRDFPNGKIDDIDAVAMGVALLEPFTAVGVSPDDSDSENDYAPLSLNFGRHCP